MLANLVNTVLGLVLVWGAVLRPGLVQQQPVNLLVFGIVAVGLAAWARSSDRMRWFSVTNIIAGLGLLVLALWQFLQPATAVTRSTELMIFWGVFWFGLVISVVAFWSALYRNPG